MAQQTINTSDTLPQGRTKLNANFTELYGTKATQTALDAVEQASIDADAQLASDIADVLDIANAAVVGGAGISAIVQITQSAYDALGTPDASTLYVVVG